MLEQGDKMEDKKHDEVKGRKQEGECGTGGKEEEKR